jgi:hypothetical protein
VVVDVLVGTAERALDKSFLVATVMFQTGPEELGLSCVEIAE